ncbi:hypothetical protein MMC34_005396 [Xylographa carneopallida]|nr:hypothetical protein [Xylographa carneopallida]
MRFSQVFLATISLVALASSYPTDFTSNLKARETAHLSGQPLRRHSAHHTHQPHRREAVSMSGIDTAAFNDYLGSIPQLRKRSAAIFMSTGQNLSLMSVRPTPKSLQTQLRRRAAAKATGSSSSGTGSKPGGSFSLPKQKGCDGCVQSVIPASIRTNLLSQIA